MKTLLLAAAVTAAVGCSTEPSTPATYGNHATESPEPSNTGITPSYPTTTTPEAPPETTTTTEPPEPILCPGRGHPLHHLSCDEAAALANPSADAPSPQARSVGRGDKPPANDVLACIRSYEQGEAGYATDTGNGFGGAYQFDQQTWSSVGGSGRPADASPAEQDKRAWALYESRGLAPWPTPARQCS